VRGRPRACWWTAFVLDVIPLMNARGLLHTDYLLRTVCGNAVHPAHRMVMDTPLLNAVCMGGQAGDLQLASALVEVISIAHQTAPPGARVPAYHRDLRDHVERHIARTVDAVK
jgi:hypothetical protein